MKKYIVLLISVLMMALGMGASAFAEEVCPEGTMLVVQPDTQEVFCIGNVPPAEEPDAAVEVAQDQNVKKKQAAAEKQKKYREIQERNRYLAEVRKQEIGDAIRMSGASVDFGLGYALYAAFQLRLTVGYHFTERLNGLSFGLYTDLGFNVGAPNSLDWAVVPMLHLNGRIFRFSMGLGLGLYSIWGSQDNSDIDVEGVWFEVKPELRWDWFLSKHAFLGVGVDMPLIISRTNHDLTEVTPWFSMNLHVGYKF